MKIALPTDDGLIIGKDFGYSRAFLVVTFEYGEITGTELRWNYFSEMLTSEHGFLYNLCDCETVVVNQIGNCHCSKLRQQGKKFIRTEEKLISDILLILQTNPVNLTLHEENRDSDLGADPTICNAQ